MNLSKVTHLGLGFCSEGISGSLRGPSLLARAWVRRWEVVECFSGPRSRVGDCKQSVVEALYMI